MLAYPSIEIEFPAAIYLKGECNTCSKKLHHVYNHIVLLVISKSLECRTDLFVFHAQKYVLDKIRHKPKHMKEVYAPPGILGDAVQVKSVQGNSLMFLGMRIGSVSSLCPLSSELLYVQELISRHAHRKQRCSGA